MMKEGIMGVSVEVGGHMGMEAAAVAAAAAAAAAAVAVAVVVLATGEAQM